MKLKSDLRAEEWIIGTTSTPWPVWGRYSSVNTGSVKQLNYSSTSCGGDGIGVGEFRGDARFAA